MSKDIIKVLDDFEQYCTNDIVSGKARSYRLGMTYLCEYLNITMLNKESLLRITLTIRDLMNNESQTYENFLQELIVTNRSSYLLNGFINAAYNHFMRFLEFKNISF